MKKKGVSLGQKVKDYLIDLAINDRLPLDMNELSAEVLDEIINKK